ncbi:MAG TPA: M28 family peptidase [Bacteroidia bacterium]|jgi:hypothetical protein
MPFKKIIPSFFSAPVIIYRLLRTANHKLQTACFLLLLLPLFSLSQENQHGDVYNYARKIIDTLAAPGMHGRGYVSGGDSIAAKYIADRFAEFGLKSFEKIDDKHPEGNYYQGFSFPVNTFPGKINFELTYTSGDILNFIPFKGKPGKNFIVDPHSPGVNYQFYGFTFDSTDATPRGFRKFEKKLGDKQCFIIYDERNVKDENKIEYFKKIKSNQLNAIGLGEIVDKLTWDVSIEAPGFTRIQLLSDSFKISSKKFQGSVLIQNSFQPHHPTQNLIAYLPGTQYPDSFIVFTAHYDHLGVMGHDENGKEVYFPGANDNASGCAMLLNLAKYYSQHPQKYSIAFMAFAGEEAGLLGSKYYTGHPLFPLKQIKFLVNFDIMGTGDEGIKVVNATEFKTEFKTLQVLNAQNSYLKEVSPRGKTSNSDHYFFYANGVKCFFIYTLGGIKAYHDIYDRPETLPLTKFEDVFRLMLDFTAWLQAD